MRSRLVLPSSSRKLDDGRQAAALLEEVEVCAIGKCLDALVIILALQKLAVRLPHRDARVLLGALRSTFVVPVFLMVSLRHRVVATDAGSLRLSPGSPPHNANCKGLMLMMASRAQDPVVNW